MQTIEQFLTIDFLTKLLLLFAVIVAALAMVTILVAIVVISIELIKDLLGK